MSYRFGDVVLVSFPFTDQSASKQRPAVVISGAAYHSARRDVIIMAVSSQLRFTAAFGEVALQDWQAARLIKPSVVKPVIATIEQRLVRKALGSLSSGDQRHVREMINQIIAR
jgi:mRNA interferase MazF